MKDIADAVKYTAALAFTAYALNVVVTLVTAGR